MKCEVLCTNASGEYFQGWLRGNEYYIPNQLWYTASSENINEYQEAGIAGSPAIAIFPPSIAHIHQELWGANLLPSFHPSPLLNKQRVSPSETADTTVSFPEFIQMSTAAFQGWLTVPRHFLQNNFHGWVCCRLVFYWVCLRHHGTTPALWTLGPLSPLQWVITDSGSNEISVFLIENGPCH